MDDVASGEGATTTTRGVGRIRDACVGRLPFMLNIVAAIASSSSCRV